MPCIELFTHDFIDGIIQLNGFQYTIRRACSQIKFVSYSKTILLWTTTCISHFWKHSSAHHFNALAIYLCLVYTWTVLFCSICSFRSVRINMGVLCMCVGAPSGMDSRSTAMAIRKRGVSWYRSLIACVGCIITILPREKNDSTWVDNISNCLHCWRWSG